MSRWSRMLRRAPLLAVAVGSCLLAEGAQAQDAVVLSSTVPGYVPGMTVASADRLNVPEGASATLLFQSGEVLRLGGPFEGELGQQHSNDQSGTVSALADLFRSHGIDATVIGGTRSINARTGPMLEDVLVDVRRSGTYCLQPSSAVWMTRPADDDRHYALRRKGSNRSLGWPSGADRVEWPSDVSIDDGSRFEIVADGTAQATITFHSLSGSGLPGVATGVLLGCHEQFDIELHRVSQSVVQPELWMTTDRGRHPTYAAGEPVTLTIMSNIDGYLYCVAGAADKGAIPLFPADAIDGAQMRSSVALNLPGRRHPMTLKAGADLQWIRCWLADRDIAPELPAALVDKTGRRIPDQIVDNLDGEFLRMPSTRIQKDAVSLTIK